MAESGGKGAGGEEPPVLVEVARYSGLGLQLAASVTLFMLGGSWVDGKLGTSPLLTVLGAFAGGAAGFYNLYRAMTRSRKDGSPER